MRDGIYLLWHNEKNHIPLVCINPDEEVNLFPSNLLTNKQFHHSSRLKRTYNLVVEDEFEINIGWD
jgi:hypothetical protein